LQWAGRRAWFWMSRRAGECMCVRAQVGQSGVAAVAMTWRTSSYSGRPSGKAIVTAPLKQSRQSCTHLLRPDKADLKEINRIACKVYLKVFQSDLYSSGHVLFRICHLLRIVHLQRTSACQLEKCKKLLQGWQFLEAKCKVPAC
jgi:hypothetical protein